MRNIEATVKGTVLTLTLDLSKDLGKSKSGKTNIIASTDGNVDLSQFGAPGVKVGLNIYK